VMLGRQLAEDARQAIEATRDGEAADAGRDAVEAEPDSPKGGRS
jgi:hypothetical protein